MVATIRIAISFFFSTEEAMVWYKVIIAHMLLVKLVNSEQNWLLPKNAEHIDIILQSKNL